MTLTHWHWQANLNLGTRISLFRKRKLKVKLIIYPRNRTKTKSRGAPVPGQARSRLFSETRVQIVKEPTAWALLMTRRDQKRRPTERRNRFLHLLRRNLEEDLPKRSQLKTRSVLYHQVRLKQSTSDNCVCKLPSHLFHPKENRHLKAISGQQIRRQLRKQSRALDLLNLMSCLMRIKDKIEHRLPIDENRIIFTTMTNISGMQELEVLRFQASLL